MASAASFDARVFHIAGSLLGAPADAQLSLQGPDDNAVVVAVVGDGPFPPGKLSLGSIQLAASTGTTVPFTSAGGKGSVTFKASASGFFEAGVYPDPSDLLHDLSPERDIASGIDLERATGSRFIMLRCGYDAGLTAKGAMALGVGASANFGGSVSRSAAYAVIHEFEDSDGSRDVLSGTIQSWILPNQFDGVDRLPPRTWLVTELDGSVALNLGVQAGYDYSWLRQFPSGVLKGDLGLKVQLAANAALGFSANGTFALALSRETDAPVVRVRLFKLAKNGWDFALNASAGEEVTLPAVFQSGHNIDDLISAVFGVHVAQLVDDLTDPSITSASNVAKFIEQRGMREFQTLTGMSPDALFAAGKAKVDQFVAEWTALTHNPATMLAAILQKNPDVKELTAFLTAIQGRNADGVKSVLAKALSGVDFFQTPVGQWIESVVPTTALSALTSTSDWKTVQDLSGKALNIINGQTLQSLIDYASKQLGLDNIQKVKNDVDAFNLDDWLQGKIAAFLGKDPTTKLVLADVQQVQTALKALLDQADKFYALARQAVQKKYEIDFTASYQKSSTSTALLDAAFDLSATPSPLPALQKAIDGDLRQLLLEPIAGVTIKAATLTHDINRQSHSDLTMPFVNLSTDSVTDSLASVSPVEDGGRVLVYKVDATNEVKDSQSLLHARTVSDSKLALVAHLPVKTGARTFSAPSVSCGYTLSKASLAMGSTQLLHDLGPLVQEYMPGLFDNGKPALSDWVAALDQSVEAGKTGVLGETLFSFDVSLAAGVFDAWYNAPANGNDKRYLAMSRAIQGRLRQMIPFYFFQSPAFYDAGVVADAILAYGALPASNGFDATGGRVGAPKNEVYFDLDGPDALVALMNTPQFDSALAATMQGVNGVLAAISKFQDMAASYVFNTVNVQRIARHALQKAFADQHLPGVLGPLLLFEFDLIQSIVKSATELAEFRAEAATNPSAAVSALSSFGDEFVQSFNSRLGGNLVAKGQLRPMGLALLVEAARALSQNAGVSGAAAGLFRLTVLGGAPAVSVDDLLAGNFDASKAILRQTLVSLQ